MDDIETAAFGCGIIPILLRKGDFETALGYVDEVRAAIVKAKRKHSGSRPKRTLKPLRATSAK